MGIDRMTLEYQNHNVTLQMLPIKMFGGSSTKLLEIVNKYYFSKFIMKNWKNFKSLPLKAMYQLLSDRVLILEMSSLF